MIKFSSLAKLEAKQGKEQKVEAFLKSALPAVEAERNTNTGDAPKIGTNKFGIVHTFPDEKNRKAHLAGKVAAALRGKAPNLFTQTPQIEQVEMRYWQ